MQLLGCVVNVWFNSLRSCQTIFREAAPFNNATSSVNSKCSKFSLNLVISISLFRVLPALIGVSWCLGVVLIPWWLSGEESTYNAGDLGSTPGSGRSPGDGNGNPLQCSGLENSMDSPWGCKESDRTEHLSLSLRFPLSKPHHQRTRAPPQRTRSTGGLSSHSYAPQAPCPTNN